MMLPEIVLFPPMITRFGNQDEKIFTLFRMMHFSPILVYGPINNVVPDGRSRADRDRADDLGVLAQRDGVPSLHRPVFRAPVHGKVPDDVGELDILQLPSLGCRREEGLPTSVQLPRASQPFRECPPSIRLGKRSRAKSIFVPTGIWSKISGLRRTIPGMARFEKISPRRSVFP